MPFGEQLSAIFTLLADESRSGVLSTVFDTIAIVAAVQVCEDVKMLSIIFLKMFTKFSARFHMLTSPFTGLVSVRINRTE